MHSAEARCPHVEVRRRGCRHQCVAPCPAHCQGHFHFFFFVLLFQIDLDRRVGIGLAIVARRIGEVAADGLPFSSTATWPRASANSFFACCVLRGRAVRALAGVDVLVEQRLARRFRGNGLLRLGQAPARIAALGLVLVEALGAVLLAGGSLRLDALGLGIGILRPVGRDILLSLPGVGRGASGGGATIFGRAVYLIGSLSGEPMSAMPARSSSVCVPTAVPVP